MQAIYNWYYIQENCSVHNNFEKPYTTARERRKAFHCVCACVHQRTCACLLMHAEVKYAQIEQADRKL